MFLGFSGLVVLGFSRRLPDLTVSVVFFSMYEIGVSFGVLRSAGGIVVSTSGMCPRNPELRLRGFGGAFKGFPAKLAMSMYTCPRESMGGRYVALTGASLNSELKWNGLGGSMIFWECPTS